MAIIECTYKKSNKTVMAFSKLSCFLKIIPPHAVRCERSVCIQISMENIRYLAVKHKDIHFKGKQTKNEKYHFLGKRKCQSGEKLIAEFTRNQFLDQPCLIISLMSNTHADDTKLEED